VIKNSPGFRRDFRVKMWGTSSPDDKLTGDLGNVIETVKIGGRGSDRLMAIELSPSNFGLLQQYLPVTEQYPLPGRCRKHKRMADISAAPSRLITITRRLFAKAIGVRKRSPACSWLKYDYGLCDDGTGQCGTPRIL
jgi:hypothetical protein